ncbi:hypothetical protein PHJA_000286400 [Phtheirospermum japonicum]|uniref:Uncharacterized protein n=1 Tax=Phtheirospermum japonicum TaxID=374723 RepID=A0A830BHC3_9LAMI|nr:hypothetical protein PHJA_000286400 [Phtheirospermum japonicum]
MGRLPRFRSSPLCVLFVRRRFRWTSSLPKSSNTLGICSFLVLEWELVLRTQSALRNLMDLRQNGLEHSQ